MWENLKKRIGFNNGKPSLTVLADISLHDEDDNQREKSITEAIVLSRLIEWLYGEPGHEANIVPLRLAADTELKKECKEIRFPALAVIDMRNDIFKVMEYPEAIKWLVKANRSIILIDGINIAPLIKSVPSR